ncbi:hypothetical protein CDD83_5722 [Cordyceps sp. RAO-2017]|nr:hypothetical protein CDD83_5722 [Cordyceps sp. RAO-2017]
MCKFSGLHDPEYEKVAGEISRHIERLQKELRIEEENFLSSLETLGCFAMKHVKIVKEKEKGTLEWLYTVGASPSIDTNMNGPVTPDQSLSLKQWLASGPKDKLFWITGPPASGKSTAMKNILESPKTMRFLSMDTTNSRPWHHIGLFVTNRGAQEQQRWQPMLHGLLLQLLRKQPALTRDLMAYLSDRGPEKQEAGRSSFDPAEKAYEWSTELVMEAIRYCKISLKSSFNALLLVDGLDELEKMRSDTAEHLVDFLKELAAEGNDGVTMSFKVCVSCRSEQEFRDSLSDAWCLQMHEHTGQDIEGYVFTKLYQTAPFRNDPRSPILRQLIRHISDHARGVFLWVTIATGLVTEAIEHRNETDELLDYLSDPSKELEALFELILTRIEPRLRRRAYIMFEVVLRARRPMTVLELLMITRVVESWLERREYEWPELGPSGSGITDFGDARRMKGQIIACCKCMLEVSQRDGSDPSQGTVQLLHQKARDFLLGPGRLDLLFESGTAERRPSRPGRTHRGNGHAYTLLFARECLRAPERLPRELKDVFNIPEEVCFHAPGLEHTLGQADPDTFFQLLDEIDRLASGSLRGGEAWPPAAAAAASAGDWHFTFPALAVSRDMRRYVARRLGPARDRNVVSVNRSQGRPLLHFAVHTAGESPKPDMARFLLERGADVHATFQGRTAIQSLYLGDAMANAEPLLSTLGVLLEHKANPNSRYWPDLVAGERRRWWPLMQLVARERHIGMAARIAIMKLLHRHGADVNGKDSTGLTLLDVLYYKGDALPPAEWDWLLGSAGAKITKKMVDRTFYDSSQLVDGQERQDSPPRRRARFLFSRRLRARFRGLARDRTDPDSPLGPASDLAGADESRGRFGLCEGHGSHDALTTLSQRKYRRKKWYYDDAAAQARKLRPDWFAHDK